MFEVYLYEQYYIAILIVNGLEWTNCKQTWVEVAMSKLQCLSKHHCVKVSLIDGKTNMLNKPLISWMVKSNLLFCNSVINTDWNT